MSNTIYIILKPMIIALELNLYTFFKLSSTKKTC